MVKIRKLPVKSGSVRRGSFSVVNLLIFLVLLLIIGFFIFNIGKSIFNSMYLFGDNRRLENRIGELYYEKLVLVEEQNSGLNDKLVEKEAKSKLGLLRPGEELLILEDISE